MDQRRRLPYLASHTRPAGIYTSSDTRAEVMADKFSFVTLQYGKEIVTKTIPRDKGIKMQMILDGEAEPDNEQQAEFLLHVKRIDPLTSHGEVIRRGFKPQVTQSTPSNLTNPGIQQGMYQALPAGDR